VVISPAWSSNLGARVQRGSAVYIAGGFRAGVATWVTMHIVRLCQPHYWYADSIGEQEVLSLVVVFEYVQSQNSMQLDP
jgi:hypothetical protein